MLTHWHIDCYILNEILVFLIICSASHITSICSVIEKPSWSEKGGGAACQQREGARRCVLEHVIHLVRGGGFHGLKGTTLNLSRDFSSKLK